MNLNKKQRLDYLNAHINMCSNCALRCESKVVFGEGNADAEIMFIGEAPGKKESEAGIPFMGSSGIILNKMLAIINIKRENVYITNILKCRPPENRDPLPEEISACLPLLIKQIEIIKPKLIVTLGRFSLNCFLPGIRISEAHGNISKIKIHNSFINIFPIHHPAAARQNKITRALFENDFKEIPQILRQLKKEQ